MAHLWRHPEIDREYERSYAVLRYHARPSTRTEFNKWYSQLASKIPNGLPPVKSAFHIDAKDFKTEIRIVFENATMCSSFVRRLIRTVFSEIGLKQVLYVDREYIENSMSPDNKWLVTMEGRNGEKETNEYKVKSQSDSKTTASRAAELQIARSIGGNGGTKRSGDDSSVLKHPKSDRNGSGWVESPRSSPDRTVKKEEDDKDSSESDEDELEKFMEASLGGKPMRKREFPNLVAIQIVEKMILKKQFQIDDRLSKLKGNKNRKEKDFDVQEYRREIEHLHTVVSALQNEKRKLGKHKLAELMRFE